MTCHSRVNESIRNWNDADTSIQPCSRKSLGAPAFPQPDGRVKTSAAWLIDHAGFAKGFALPDSRVAISTKHVLALTNRGGGTTAQLLALAQEIQAGVSKTYGIALVPEPVFVRT